MKTYITTKPLIFLLCALLSSTSAFAKQSDIDAIEEAYYHGKVETLLTLREQTSGYERFLASYRLAIQYRGQGKQQEESQLLENLITELKQYVQNNPTDADSIALLGNVYGYSIGANPIKAMSYGPRAQTTIAQAMDLDPDNPRVLMFKGIMDLHAPKMFGGSDDSALKAFLTALEKFPADRNSERHWGYSDTLVWLGVAYQKQGDMKTARDYWQQALGANPNNGQATHLLNTAADE